MAVATVENPLRAGLRLGRTPQPATMAIFGVTGDLAQRKLLPALYNLKLDRLLPVGFSVVGVGRKEMTDNEFRSFVKTALEEFSRRPLVPAVWESMAEGLRYCAMDFQDHKSYRALAKTLDEVDGERGTGGNRVFYLSVPPSLFTTIIDCLGETKLNHQNHNFARVVIEKPFGHDLESAGTLNRDVNRVFREEQVYRIDHYLGKETVQNILVFRFSNGIFEPIWNRDYIDHIQITVAEAIGVGSRGGYYEEAGALRDMVANHMLQLLSLVAMEPPVDFLADDVRDEKVKVLKAIGPLTPDVPVVRARYGPGWIGGERVKGYLEEQGVPPDSRTESFVALKMLVDNWRWAGVPFYLRHGKRLPKRVTEIAIQFKRPPTRLFQTAGLPEANTLAFRIQPDEGISLRFIAKGPGQTLQLRPVTMDFLYGTSFDIDPPEAYERLLLDCLLGDSTLFTRRDEVEAAWTILDPLLQSWRDSYPWDLSTYESGTWGPVEAEELMARDGRVWRRL